ncbi:U6 snRNA-associated Sm-like protein LSm3-like [Hibiscus syriacus]|uniref:U6 snRNA-associated Sm-like protein LSm3-like n=1 Tax=Hibiscus syriacus TaxID=106335 RepID=A0A6A3A3N4_HIBSY|nr:U6 snRNA-associated Sm-like protein LSm3-like [Hibiscus syriacus]
MTMEQSERSYLLLGGYAAGQHVYHLQTDSNEDVYIVFCPQRPDGSAQTSGPSPREKEKDDVRKILSSKHLFYEEMCSYHNGNILHLPHDLQLQRSLQLALRRESASHGDNRVICGASGISTKKSRQSQVHKDSCFQNLLNSQHCHNNSFSYPSVAQANANQALLDYSRDAWMQKQWIESRTLQLEEKKLQIQVELEKQRFKWQRFSKRRDRELDKMRMENERMKLEMNE